MFKEILTPEQSNVIPLIKLFTVDFMLVGGTAIALQIGHRRSLDFDLCSREQIKSQSIINKIIKNNYRVDEIFTQNIDELTLIVNGIKITYFSYPFPVSAKKKFENKIDMPDLLDLAAMKSYALGQRSKWKDYVDLYFLLKEHFTLEEVVKRTKEIFHSVFNERLFREQLCYFDDIDSSETIDFLGRKIDNSIIQRFLTEIAIS